MGKGKPRTYPDKKQNNYPSYCSYHDISNGHEICEAGVISPTCGGNRHNCVKEKYKLLASIPMDRRWKETSNESISDE